MIHKETVVYCYSNFDVVHVNYCYLDARIASIGLEDIYVYHFHQSELFPKSYSKLHTVLNHRTSGVPYQLILERKLVGHTNLIKITY